MYVILNSDLLDKSKSLFFILKLVRFAFLWSLIYERDVLTNISIGDKIRQRNLKEEVYEKDICIIAFVVYAYINVFVL